AEDGIRDYKVTGVQTCVFRSVETAHAGQAGEERRVAHARAREHEARDHDDEREPHARLVAEEGAQQLARTVPPAGRTATRQLGEIGRASCRERGYGWAVAGAV